MKPTPNSSRSRKDFMMLNLNKTTHGEGASDDDLAGTKQAIWICIDINEVLHTFRHTCCCALIFFKESSTIVDATIKSWKQCIKSHLIEYEDRAAAN
eukprot:scaffold101813_cov41-Attheya_sp.AAC.2